jgi:6-phosphofructokinase 1
MMARIAVLTSGGDAPGMNAAVRAVVRTAAMHGMEAAGVRRGFAGLISDDIMPLGIRDVGGIIERAGTVLGSARCPEFKERAVQERALAFLAARGIGGIVVIGGNGSQMGAAALHALGFPVVGVASTIDNDLVGSDFTIGFDSALTVAVEAIDRVRVTASSHRRCILVEVMGRDCGHLALMAAVASGADAIVLPEAPASAAEVAAEIRAGHARGKSHAVVVVAEGAPGGAAGLAEQLKQVDPGYDVRVTVLGHVQRGGVPTPFDRLLGSRLGAAAVDRLATGASGVVMGIIRGELRDTPYADVVNRLKPLDEELLRLAHSLAK